MTRDSLIKIAKDLKIEVREEPMTRDQLYIADEVFLCGTAAELTPVREIDGRPVGTRTHHKETPGHLFQGCARKGRQIQEMERVHLSLFFIPSTAGWSNGFTPNNCA